MQNIKYCSSCNKTFTDSSISFCPFDGTGLVQLQHVQPVPMPTPKTPPKTQPSQLTKTNNLLGILKLVGIALGIIFVFSLVLSFFQKSNNSNNSVAKNENNAVAKTTSPSPILTSTPIVNLAPNQIDTVDPAVIKSRTSKGEQVYKRITAKYGLPVMFGWQGADISLLIPIREWNNLSKDEQVNLTYYAESFTQVISQNPRPFIDKWAQYVKAVEGDSFNYDGLTQGSFISQASSLCSTCWSITTGTVKGREFYEETTPVTGSNAEGFRQSQEKENSKTDKEKDAEEAVDFAASMSAGEHLKEAREALDSGYNPQKEYFGNTELAKKHMKSIRSNAPEYKEAQALLKNVIKRERERKEYQDAVVKEVMRMAEGK